MDFKKIISLQKETSITEHDLKEIFLIQYSSLFPKLLKKSCEEILSLLKREIILYLRIIDKQVDFLMLSKFYDEYDNIIRNDKIKVKKIFKDIKKNITNYSTLDILDVYIHCSNCYEAIHKCGNKLYIFNNLFFCLKCEKVYNSNYILLFCNSCNKEYITSQRPNLEKNNKYLYSTSFSQYHCVSEKEEKIGCLKCGNDLYYNLNESRVKFLSKQEISYLYCINCKLVFNSKNMIFKCKICGQNFKSEPKIYRNFSFIKEYLLLLVKTFRKNKYVHPDIITNKKCKCDLNNVQYFLHKDNGRLYEGKKNGQLIIICDHCYGIFKPENINWSCPTCGAYFKGIKKNKMKNVKMDNNNKLKKSINTLNHISYNSNNFCTEKNENNKTKKKININKLYNSCDKSNANNLTKSITNSKVNGKEKMNSINISNKRKILIQTINDRNKFITAKKKPLSASAPPKIIKSIFKNEYTKLTQLFLSKKKNDFNKINRIETNINRSINNANIHIKLGSKLSPANLNKKKRSNKKIRNLFLSEINSIPNLKINNDKNLSIKEKNNKLNLKNLFPRNKTKIRNSNNINNIDSNRDVIINKYNVNLSEIKAIKKGNFLDKILSGKNKKNKYKKKKLNMKLNQQNHNQDLYKSVKFEKDKFVKKLLIPDSKKNEKQKGKNDIVIKIKLKNHKNNKLEEKSQLINNKNKIIKIKKLIINQINLNNTSNSNPQSYNIINISKRDEENEKTEIKDYINNRKKENKPQKKINTKYNNKSYSFNNEKDKYKTLIKNLKSHFSSKISESQFNPNLNHSFYLHRKAKTTSDFNEDISINNINSDYYSIIQLIGKGTYGKIYLVEDPETKMVYALKKINIGESYELKENLEEYKLTYKLININPKLKIVKKYGIEIKKLDKYNLVMYILMEPANCDWEQELINRRKDSAYYTEDQIMSILKSLVQTFSELQKMGISHRDVKPQNILCYGEEGYKLSDFGEAKTKTDDIEIINNTQRQTIRGTELYMSPILFKALRLNIKEQVEYNAFKSDVFSLGMCFLLASSLNYQSLFEIREIYDMDIIAKVVEKYLGNIYSKNFINLILMMLNVDEKLRPDFIELNSLLN